MLSAQPFSKRGVSKTHHTIPIKQNMFSGSSEHAQMTTLQIEQDDKFFCRLLSKESAISNTSFRQAVAVPFVWESQPGTPNPKYTFSADTLPPLTPPPSYYFNTISACKKTVNKRSRSMLLLQALFPKLKLKESILSSSPSSLSSSFSSRASSDSSRVIPVARNRRKRFLSCGSSLDFLGDDEEDDAGLPTSTLCFGIRRITRSNSGLLGCCRKPASRN